MSSGYEFNTHTQGGGKEGPRKGEGAGLGLALGRKDRRSPRGVEPRSKREAALGDGCVWWWRQWFACSMTHALDHTQGKDPSAGSPQAYKREQAAT